jgi:hypothetical protein
LTHEWEGRISRVPSFEAAGYPAGVLWALGVFAVWTFSCLTEWIGRGRDARAAGLGVWPWGLGFGVGRWSVVQMAHLFDDDVTKCARDLNSV